jgi:transposase-like protein
MTPAERIATALGGRPSGAGYQCRCPVHDDREPSLSVTDGHDGKLLVHCFAGCPADAVLAALRQRGFIDVPGQGERGVPIPSDNTATPQRSGCTLADYAQAKGLPEGFLRSIGVSEISRNGRPAVRIPYDADHGVEIAVRFRIALTGDRFRWRKGSKPCLYGLDRLAQARAEGVVALVEGESCTQTLWHHGIAAVGLPGANSWNERRDTPALADIPKVYVVVEPDAGGETIKHWLVTSALRDRALLVSLAPFKDASALYLDDPARFLERWQAALAAAVPFATVAERDAQEHTAAALSRCRGLANAPDILDRFGRDLAARGYVGDMQVPQLLYLAMTSRLLDRIVSVAVRGPSSGGKSFAVQKVLDFFPGDAFYTLTAMSERALAYSEEPLRQRMLVLYEAAGLSGHFASYLMRSLLSEGRISYETVEKTTDGLRPRRIVREGPTGLIVTTTAVRFHPENETRLLSLTVSDSTAQTRAVIAALARPSAPDGVDIGAWHALQDWLAVQHSDVSIPYAEQLASLVPPVAVRLRRDFGVVLALIRAHAALHQKTRARDEAGRIIATIPDYAAVRALIADVLAEGIEATVPPSVRETVEAVATLAEEFPDGVSVAALARTLGLDKASASRRWRDAAARGYLTNQETGKGKPARLTIGEEMPSDVEILPRPETLEKDRCAVAGETGGIDTPPPLTNHRSARTPAWPRPPSWPWLVALPRKGATKGSSNERRGDPGQPGTKGIPPPGEHGARRDYREPVQPVDRRRAQPHPGTQSGNHRRPHDLRNPGPLRRACGDRGVRSRAEPAGGGGPGLGIRDRHVLQLSPRPGEQRDGMPGMWSPARG